MLNNARYYIFSPNTSRCSPSLNVYITDQKIAGSEKRLHFDLHDS